MGEYVDDGQRPAPNRREFIRRGAMLLGVGAWAAPLVQVVRHHRPGGAEGDALTEQIGVQQVTSDCLTCVVTCAEPPICGSSGVFDCICAPSADAYPLTACVCAVAIFCEEATPCSQGCPPGYACAQGCCDEPVCLPPCPAETPLAPFAAAEPGPGGGRVTVSGKRI